MERETNYRVEKIVDMLNEAYKLDSSAMHLLMMSRNSCNEEFAEKSIFFCNKDENHNYCYVSPLGFINGILYELGVNRIASKYDTENNKFLGFCLYDENIEKE